MDGTGYGNFWFSHSELVVPALLDGGYYKLSPTDMVALEKKCERLAIPVNRGDVVFWAGGTMVHASPAVPEGVATRFMTYAHWEEAAASADGSGAL